MKIHFSDSIILPSAPKHVSFHNTSWLRKCTKGFLMLRGQWECKARGKVPSGHASGYSLRAKREARFFPTIIVWISYWKPEKMYLLSNKYIYMYVCMYKIFRKLHFHLLWFTGISEMFHVSFGIWTRPSYHLSYKTIPKI